MLHICASNKNLLKIENKESYFKNHVLAIVRSGVDLTQKLIGHFFMIVSYGLKEYSDLWCTKLRENNLIENVRNILDDHAKTVPKYLDLCLLVHQ